MVFEGGNTAKCDKKNLLEREICKLFVSQCKNIKELNWETSQSLSSFPGATTFFHNLNSLSIKMDHVDSNTLYEVAQICIHLKELTLYNVSQNNHGLTSLIDAQRNLKNVSLYPYYSKKGICKELGEALTRKSNTINYLCLYSVNIIPLMSLVNLRHLLIYNFENYKDFDEVIKVFQKYLEVSKFPKLQSFDIRGLSCFKEMATLIENTEGNIREISIVTTNKFAKNTGMFIETIVNNCPKIEELSTYLEPKDFIYVESLLQNCRNLVDLRFDSLNFNEIHNNIGDKLLDTLAKFSPKSLISISISRNWKYSIDAFERFFESFRGRNLRSFFILYCDIYSITNEHRLIVRKYLNEGVIKESNCVF
ncbi:hypothetical protein C1645_735985 [Glomus cerebriforme]|uniref:F-box domain-containing protein n=1 Tax=Glomus cerebriforme TaxID=658196 RepID=A0A397T6C6_9GLOM|nr:hypothetical protein C1645_735985 [Glomus cerebriforme]